MTGSYSCTMSSLHSTREGMGVGNASLSWELSGPGWILLRKQNPKELQKRTAAVQGGHPGPFTKHYEQCRVTPTPSLISQGFIQDAF
jgi:hypothetical protein